MRRARRVLIAVVALLTGRNLLPRSPDLGADRFDVFPDDDPIHLDPNSCQCDGCQQVVTVIRELLRLDAIAEADMRLWELEGGWVNG